MSKSFHKGDNNTTKYKLSFKLVVSRLGLALLIFFVLGFLTIPFLRNAEGLNFYQKAAIGQQNIIKITVLLAVFIALIGVLTFWKKHFRMVTIFLICIWVLGASFVTTSIFEDRTSLMCKRVDPYQMDREFVRSLDLIEQRMGTENNTGYPWAIAYDYRNCIQISYSDENISLGTEGLFFSEDPSLQKLRITVSPVYKNFDDLSIATILIHELTHVGQYITDIVDNTADDCFEDEADAFLYQLVLLNKLNKEEQRSVVARIENNSDKNPAFTILLGMLSLQNEAYQNCSSIRNENKLTDAQFNSCVWTGTKNKVKVAIETDQFYIKQCK